MAVDAIRVLLIAEQGEARKAYVSALDELGVAYDAILSPDEIQDRLNNTPYNGLLVDVPTMIRSASKEKQRVNQAQEWFPTLKLLYNPQYGGIRGMHAGGTVNQNLSLAEFVQGECTRFTARTVRLAVRAELIFNVVLLARPDQPLHEAERSVTMNISELGCFVFTVRDWRTQGRCWLRFQEFGETGPIEAQVRWQRPWGESMRIPGIGVSFPALTPAQRAGILSRL